MNGHPWRIATIVTSLVALAAAAIAWAVAGRFTWGPPETPKAQCEAFDAASLATPSPSPTTVRYQERVAAAVIREPENTWSNLAFVFVGVLIAAHDRRVFARLLGASLIALGIASGLYHASLLPSLRTVDVATMGWVSFALCCHGYAAARRSSDQSAAASSELWIGLIGGALAMTAAFFRNDVRVGGIKPFDTTYTTAAGITGVFLIAAFGVLRALRAHPEIRLPVARFGTLAAVVAVALFCQLNDRIGRCLGTPGAVIQGHAVWHVLMAAAAAMAYDVFAFIESQSSLWRRQTRT
jgi:hypothetical protein